MKKIICLLLCFSMFLFFGIRSVDAALPTKRTETKNGYAFCRYTVSGFQGKTLVARTWVYYNKNGKVKTGADVDLVASDNSSTNVPLPNYDSYNRDNDLMMAFFYKNKKFSCAENNVTFTFLDMKNFSKGGNLVFGTNCTPGIACYNLILDKSSNNISNKKNAVFNDKGSQTGSSVTGGDTTKNEEKNETNKDNTQTQDDLKHYLDGVPSLQEIKDYYGKDPTSNYSNDSGDCNLIDDDLKNLLNTIFTWISIGGIILVIVMTCVSGIKVITGTEDAIKDFAKGLKVRIICLVVLLLAPVIVNFAIQTVNGVGNIAGVNQDDPLCGVGK